MSGVLSQTSSSIDEDDSSWLGVSDLMAGLMMVFLCIAVAMMHSVLIEREKIRTIAMSYKENQLAIFRALENEFELDLPRWGASIDRETLTVAFNNSDAMFATGEAQLTEGYRQVFEEFFPRYMNILQPFTESIEAVRIEGHTSSGWGADSGLTESYFNNLRLSQDRARSVLKSVYTLPSISNYQQWMMRRVAAVGYSSSRPILNTDGSENVERSKRVAFRVVTNSETKIHSILSEDF